jgi:TniQ
MAAAGLPLLQPLPRQVKPFPGETTASYLRRLALANRLDAEALRYDITGSRRRSGPFPAARLSVMTSLPERTLRCALPDLGLARGGQAQDRPGFTPGKGDHRPACRLCVLARGITETVWRWKQPENVICLRHCRWIDSWTSEDQPGLSAQPAILQAHRRHLRLIRRFGREVVALGRAYANDICQEWHSQRQHDEGFRQRMEIFHGPEWRLAPTAPTIAAAIYPQAVALTRLLTSPHWQAQARSHEPSGQGRFAREIGRTVAPGYVWPQAQRSTDPLYQWILETRLAHSHMLPGPTDGPSPHGLTEP